MAREKVRGRGGKTGEEKGQIQSPPCPALRGPAAPCIHAPLGGPQSVSPRWACAGGSSAGFALEVWWVASCLVFQCRYWRADLALVWDEARSDEPSVAF